MKKSEVEKKNRKTRSDKKRDLKPIVSLELYESMARLAYITCLPMKDIGEKICRAGLNSEKVISLLSAQFRRDYLMNDSTLFPGTCNIEKSRVIRQEGDRARLAFRFPQELYERLTDLAYALDLTVSSVTALLLEVSLKNTRIIHLCLKEYIENNLDQARLKQLKEVLAFLNKNNPYKERVTLPVLLDYVADECMSPNKNIKQVLREWIDDFFSEKA